MHDNHLFKVQIEGFVYQQQILSFYVFSQPSFLTTPVCVPAHTRTPKTKWREWNKDPHLTDLSDLISIPCSPTFVYHQPYFLSRNLRFGLRLWRDGSRPRRRQKVYPLAPRPPVASIAPCSPAPPPTNHTVNRQSFITMVKGSLLSRWHQTIPREPHLYLPSILEASIQQDEWKGQDNTREMDTGPRWQDKSRYRCCWLLVFRHRVCQVLVGWIHIPDRVRFIFMEQSLEVRRDEVFTPCM